MEFYKPAAARAGKAMQSIDILRDNGLKLSGSFESDDGVMDRIRLSVAECIAAFQLVVPMLYTRRFRAHEILEVNRLSPFPDTLRTAEVWNAAAGRDSGTGKDNCLTRRPKVVSECHRSSRSAQRAVSIRL
jgi:hypothetical protein